MNAKASEGGPFFPMLLTHGLVASWRKNKIACGVEHLGARHQHVRRRQRQVYLRAQADPREAQPAPTIVLASNGLCVSTFGAFVLSVLCNTRRVAKPNIPRFLAPQVSAANSCGGNVEASGSRCSEPMLSRTPTLMTREMSMTLICSTREGSLVERMRFALSRTMASYIFLVVPMAYDGQ